MSNRTSPISRFPAFRRLWRPALATGAGGTGIIIWFEEIMLFAVEIVSVMLVIVLGGLVCLFDHFFFKSRMPRREAEQNNKGDKN